MHILYTDRTVEPHQFIDAARQLHDEPHYAVHCITDCSLFYAGRLEALSLSSAVACRELLKADVGSVASAKCFV